MNRQAEAEALGNVAFLPAQSSPQASRQEEDRKASPPGSQQRHFLPASSRSGVQWPSHARPWDPGPRARNSPGTRKQVPLEDSASQRQQQLGSEDGVMGP